MCLGYILVLVPVSQIIHGYLLRAGMPVRLIEAFNI